jgi:hypothetical protein
MKNKIAGLNVLVCGSQKFDDQEFVFCTLDTFYASTKGNIRKIYTSKFSGACEFAGEWAKRKNATLPAEQHIEISDYVFDMVLEQKNQAFYEDSEIPPYAIANDPFFRKGKEQLMSKGVNLVMCFPNLEGKLGASTANIKRFADLANIHYFNCAELYGLVNQHKSEVENTADKAVEEQAQSPRFNNRHPNRR